MKDELKNKSATGTHNSSLASGETAKGPFLVYQAEDGKLKLDVRFEDESVWLSQGLMAELFQKDVRTISEHIQNIYEEGELIPEATIRKFRIVRMEGKRQVARMVDFYNRDMIISVGYRVKNHVANRFHIWATQQLTEFIKKGFVLDDERSEKEMGSLFVSIGVHSWLKTGDSKNDKFQYP
jgi:hypothetical protein